LSRASKSEVEEAETAAKAARERVTNVLKCILVLDAGKSKLWKDVTGVNFTLQC
jgi:hypothetical protein